MKQGWVKLKLGDICDIQNGFAFKSKEYVTEGARVIRITNVQSGKIVDNSPRFISTNRLAKFKRFELNENDILVSLTGDVGRVGKVPAEMMPCLLNQRVGRFNNIDTEIIDIDFFYHFLNSNVFEEMAINTSKGAAQLNTSTTKLKGLSIVIPPIKEQKQIVSILDVAFEKIEQAKANIEKNIENVLELGESRKQQIFETLSLEFEAKPIVSGCEQIFAGGDAPKENMSKEKTDEYDIPIIANAVKDNGLYGYTNKARVTKPSITVAARGSGTGHTEYRDYPFLPIVRLIVLTPDTSVLEVKFLLYAIKSLVIKRSGSAIPQLTVPMMKSYTIPIPEIEVQKKVVSELDVLIHRLEDYKAKMIEKLELLDELKKSILQKAFTGELTNKTVVA